MNRLHLLMALGAALMVSTLFIAVRGRVARAATQNVAVADFSFTDATSGNSTTTITAGDQVTWTWTAGSHSVTADDMSFDSDPPPPGYRTSGSYDHTFSSPGTYAYYCRLHAPGMTGTIVVQAAMPTSTSTPPPAATDTPGASNTPVTRTSTPRPTDTQVATDTPAPPLTPVAAVSAPAGGTRDTTGAAEGAGQLPSAGFGGGRSVTLVWPALALALAGLSSIGGAIAWRKRA